MYVGRECFSGDLRVYGRARGNLAWMTWPSAASDCPEGAKSVMDVGLSPWRVASRELLIWRIRAGWADGGLQLLKFLHLVLGLGSLALLPV
jgi:hypothetical protein